jgi:hypothetical protein
MLNMSPNLASHDAFDKCVERAVDYRSKAANIASASVSKRQNSASKSVAVVDGW